MIRIGVRVIQGPDWDPNNHQDGGLGHLGTIIDVSLKSQTCTVQWDNGNLTTNCLASSDHQDLRIVYTESTVPQSTNHFAYCDASQCNNKQHSVNGIRYKCVTCKDYDLCIKSYMADEHDKTHPFVRLNTRLSKVVPMLPRVRSKRSKLYGFGPGASVMLTPFATSSHTEEIGKIKETMEIDGGSAKIEWQSGEVTTHCTGKDGLVEIQLVETHHVGYVYIDHLPVADMSLPVDSCINVGDKVRLDLNIDTFKGLMQDYGGWNEEMEKIMGETGSVVGLPTKNQCEVYFKSVARTWLIYIASLTKVSVPLVGHKVTVLADVAIVKRRQGRKWQEEMRNYVGKSGTVKHIDEKGYLTVSFTGNISLVFNPSCVVKDDSHTLEMNDSSENDDDQTETNCKIVVVDGSPVVNDLAPSGDKDIKTSDDKNLTSSDDNDITPDNLDSSDNSSTCSSDDDTSSDDEDRIYNTTMVIAPGLRVVRGRDWRWTDQDGGEGHMGTVQEISGVGQTSCPDKCAAVLWDNGYRNTYRIGFEGCYDLRIYDTAGVAGNRHRNVKCTEPTCEEEEDEIMGMAWQCVSNQQIILCNNCYHGDKGDVTQPFLRIDYPGHKGVKVPKRQMSQRHKLLGIDIGARVIRGANWRWANQDGGAGQQGEVIAIVNFSLDTDHDAAEVTWGNEHTNVYRLGYEGSVDLKCIKPGNTKYYYPLHLPELKMPEEPIHVPHPESPIPDFDPSPADGRLRPGDNVQIGVDPDVLQSIQKEMKNWKDAMMDLIGITGKVEGVDSQSVTVNYSGERFNLHEMVLKKVEVFKQGEFVQILNDIGKVQILQNGHGDWNDLTRKSLGKVGKVQSINVDGDVKVTFGEITLTFNPECLSKAGGPADILDTVMRRSPTPEPEPPREPVRPAVNFQTAVNEGMESEVLIHLNREISTENKQKLVKGQGNFHPVYTACKNGHAGVLKELLKYADRNALEEGDEKNTPLQIAVKKQHDECVDLLLSHNVNKDAVNDHLQSAVHLAVQNRDVKTLRVLKKHQCDINLKDSLGDSAVVDAIVRQQGDNVEMLNVILDWTNIDLDFSNNNGFSPIHIAARKGDLGAVQILLKKDPNLLNKKKPDGYTPLHLAACMDHLEVVKFLLDQPGLIVDDKTDKGQTALLIACFYGSKRTVEFLLSDKYNCQVDVTDKDGNNALHLCLSGPPQVMEIADIQRTNPRVDEGKQIKPQLDLAQFLLDKGVPYMTKNNQGKPPQDLALVPKLKTEFMELVKARLERDHHKLCPLCQEEGNEVYAVYLVKPCGCSLCNGCFMPKFKRCPNCGITIDSFDKLKRK